MEKHSFCQQIWDTEAMRAAEDGRDPDRRKRILVDKGTTTRMYVLPKMPLSLMLGNQACIEKSVLPSDDMNQYRTDLARR